MLFYTFRTIIQSRLRPWQKFKQFERHYSAKACIIHLVQEKLIECLPSIVQGIKKTKVAKIKSVL